MKEFSLNLPQIKGVVHSTEDGLYQVVDHDIEDKTAIAGINRVLTDEKLHRLEDAGFHLLDSYELPYVGKGKKFVDLLIPKRCIFWIFRTP